jgi:GNAT superfamily N-acetyltransferase
MLIERFDPRGEASKLRACYDITKAGWPIDHPDEPTWAVDSFTGKWAEGFDTAPLQAWLATDDSGTPVGCYLLRLPDRENLTMARCILAIDPARRRAGIGTALLAHCGTQARRAGRSRLVGFVRDDTPGAAFAAAVGARGGIPDLTRVLHVDAALAARLASLRADAQSQAGGYSLLSWVGPTPDEHINQVVMVHGAMADAPRDEGVDPNVWDADRVRRSEQIMVESGLTHYVVAARHDASGSVAALTEIVTEADTPDWAFQQVTAVLPEHRGHRLGLLVKIAMMELLTDREPNVRHIQTGNAGANDHMIAINEALGYQVTCVYRDWELDLRAAPQLDLRAARQLDRPAAAPAQS